MKPKDGGPAFPLQSIGPDFLPGHAGMSLRDWFAGQETLGEWDHPDAEPSMYMCEALAGRPMPDHGWCVQNQAQYLDMMRWTADWRAALKYIRADAMLAASKEKQ